MVAGLKFLSKKGFNPQNLANQKRVWEREQEKKEASKKAAEREAQLKRERDDEELTLARGDTPKLGFLYAVPPGIEEKKKKEAGVETNNSSRSEADVDRKPAPACLSDRHPGDDDAAAAFRRLLATSAATNDEETSETDSHAVAIRAKENTVAFGTVLQGTSYEAVDKTKKGTNDQRSALEKAVGRRDAVGGAALSLDEQVQRFPALANAPRAKGMTATDIGVTFKPLGTQIRNVKCLACGIWGHSKGDRECQKSGWDPFAAVVARPTTHASTTTADVWHQGDEKERRQRSRKDDRHRSSRKNSSSSDASSSYERRKLRKKHKKDERRSNTKRRRNHDRSDNDDDDDESYHNDRRHHRRSTSDRGDHNRNDLVEHRRLEDDVDLREDHKHRHHAKLSKKQKRDRDR